MNAMGVLTSQPQPTGSGEGQFFGNSSIASLLQGIQRSSEVTESDSNLTLPRNLENQWYNLEKTLLKPVAQFDFENLSLPPRALADHLLDCYWSGVHTLYPFIHKPSFLRGYSRLWTREQHTPVSHDEQTEVGLGDIRSSPIIFYCSLNSMFALGCQYSTLAGAEREMKSEVFLQRANNLLRHIDLLGRGDLSLVQALLLNAHYLQSTSYADRCWNVIGVACRMAEGIGLHSTDYDSRWSYEELQMKRYIWHSCVMLDV